MSVSLYACVTMLACVCAQRRDLSRGQTLDAAAIRTFIGTLKIPDDARERLLALTPATYVGFAPQLADSV